MRTFFSFFFIMVIGFLIFIPVLLLIIPFIGIKVFLIIASLFIFGFFVEIFKSYFG
ncbi:hypothetical protein SAMN04487944_10859 [Gracilibacillus ureilyticus]|uniref:Uncharacterized protein n=1 Tax=Gracilibacillus ureilyticus TaxID=531814 RepID=A0A1H9R7Q4_9BACI|nr:hypothetical protein [Gracilibacillus ureilyticus]SER68742.1 hypothetical protein SAMN04487944_10859 [Gracilibacillus ureilyticus]